MNVWIHRLTWSLLALFTPGLCAGEQTPPPKPKVEKAKIELQPIRTLDGAFKPYVDLEIPKTAKDQPAAADQEKLRLAPGISGDVFKDPTSRLTLSGQSQWEYDGDPSAEFRHARDAAGARYRFDDGIAWAQWDRALSFEYEGSGASQRTVAEERRSSSAGHRFDLAEMSAYTRNSYRYRFGIADPVPLRQEQADGLELNFTALDFFRPRLGVESSEVDRFGASTRNRKLDDVSRDRYSAGAEGRWNEWLNWKAAWQGWMAGDEWAPAVDSASAWEKEKVDLDLQTRVAPTHTALGLNLRREEGYLRESIFRASDGYGVTLRQPFGERFSAKMGGDFSRRSDSNAEAERRAKAGLSADYRLHKRTAIGAGYEYSRVETERPNASAQASEERAVKFEFKMKW
ncbi:MAG: hypothetical protein AMXMBFR7_07050 [Planctomycetota bacterium]